VCNDPHFLGLNNVRYNFQGAVDTTFALVSDSTVEINSHFIADHFHEQNFTYLGPTCIRSCDQTVVLNPDQTIEINGHRHRFTYTDQTLIQNSAISVQMLTPKVAVVTIPGKWSFEIAMLGDRININHVYVGHHDDNVHGVLGHTLGLLPGREHRKCNSFEEGGCQVEGVFQDYIVHGDLCSTLWTHQRFDHTKCQAQ